MTAHDYPRSIHRCRLAAILLLMLLFAAPVATHAGVVPYQLGLALSALAVLGSTLLLCAALLMLMLGRFKAHKARLGVVAMIAALPCIIGIAIMVPGAGLPVIHDISTDLADPPQFEAVLALRGPDSNPLERDAQLDAEQLRGYPDLGSIESSLSAADAFAHALATANELGWTIHTTDEARGMLEASETTFWFGFTDDIAVRVREHGNASRIDLRSVSRVGRGDLGANAKRIARFAESFAQSP